MIETSSDLLRSSSAIFVKCSEMFGSVCLAFGEQFRKVVGNLWKIVKNVVISMFT